ncbi:MULTISPECIES: 3-hydroxyacyl-CoA dehydrogenase family protein [Streptomyces]|uniref:3-hydroxyacyl-CoA dehydrogenase family protein n=3 Tax=Streptomyces TaxID=1883 RepID=A0ABD5JH32_9ACTN|nr:MULTISPECIES: 3-hydroxyacyl-CoA dehydrogenase family protein [Streptomyces]MEE4586484.1 3-hydroxyacyl-CoA dehydrogenase family protein [Streptomyces sp. DSM 41602]AJZ85051.1 3-hydroxyacyl-CoA dehydrogenase family protein [Streptomyces sp. AgN23]KUL48204.1 3-hydroxyacyl-CoA dehydrogenase [Streptomyces violaceusniger]RSS45894.1 3-hydroxyacyl-CoA dehydrogenase family protein [Streptomyces sp. WAC05858]WTA80770.1 3-hydroxyacyl-CoA dehydrogenase family protein [Streptomyces antimycoticus]
MASSASDTIAVVGAGVMGRNITALALGRGVDVVLVDVSGDVLESARAEIAQLLRHGQFMGAFPASQATGTLTTTLSSGDVADAEVVIEAITEDAALKARVMAELSGTVPAGVPLITNTSGIPIAELAKSVQRPAELAGVHFMNPSYLIEMVEVVRGPQTGEDAMAAILSLLERLGRKTVVVRDAPGFVTSRLLHPMINEAARIVAEGTASVEDVDQLMHGCLGHPTGPLRTADLIGLDNLADALRLLAERTGNSTFEPCELLMEKVRAGDLGRKTGRGFYNYGEVLS